mgnify:CR=1
MRVSAHELKPEDNLSLQRPINDVSCPRCERGFGEQEDSSLRIFIQLSLKREIDFPARVYRVGQS